VEYGDDGRADLAEVATALVDLAQWLRRAKGEEGWLAALRFGVAGGLAQANHSAMAEDLYRDIVSETPQHFWAWIGLIELALARGDAHAAAAFGRAAMLHLPDAALIRRKTAEALEQAEGVAAAIALLDPLGQIPTEVDDLAYAISLLRTALRVGDVAPLCDALLAVRPTHALALLAQIEMRLAHGDDAGAAAAAMAALDQHPEHGEIRLRAAQAYLRLGQIADAAMVCAAAPDDPGLGDEYAAFRHALAQASPAPTITATHVPWYRALADVAQAVDAGDLVLADQMAKGFDRSGWSVTEQRAFAIEHCLLRHGPRAALELIRQSPVARRDQESAERLGRVLLYAGCGARAARYLWFCALRWPGDPGIMQLACDALHCAGQAALVPRLLARTGAAQDADAVMGHRLTATLRMGRDDLVRDICGAAVVDRPLRVMIKAHLLCGDLAAAEACLARLRGDEGKLEHALIHQPRATWLGSLLNEARILAAVAPENGVDDPAASAALVADYFLRARPVVASLGDDEQPSPAAQLAENSALPRIIHLVWPGLDPEAADDQRVVAAWAKRTGFVIAAASLDDGAAWLAKHHGSRSALAYRMLTAPDQKADLLRYGLLLLRGGVALGAPQWPGDDLARWLDQHGSTRFFRDEVGAVMTDVIIAPPGHRVIALALEMAINACLARENEHRWFKTGPGLLTRAAARCHAEGALGPHIAPVSSEQILRRYLHPYGPIAR